MNAHEKQRLLLEYLAAGEWTDVSVVEPDGLMDRRGWAVFGTARSLRDNGSKVFIKLFLASGQGAGPQTELATSRRRLTGLAVRLKAIARRADIPIVRIFECETNDAGMLLIMESATTIKSLLESGPLAADEIAKLLRDLDPPADCCHFDICPRNVARTFSGKFVFLDLDSLYMADDSDFKISLPACKWPRLPAELSDRLLREIDSGSIRQSVVAAKQEFETILLATEACVGFALLSPVIGALSDGRKDEVATAALCGHSPPARVLGEALFASARGERIDLRPLAERLVVVAKIGHNSSMIPSVTSHHNSSSTMVDAAAPTAPALVPSQYNAPPAGPRTWDDLGPTRKLLRLDRLTAAQIALLRADLRAILANDSANTPAWKELLFLLIGYERDFSAALAATRQMLDIHPSDEEAQRWLRILTLAVAGTGSGL